LRAPFISTKLPAHFFKPLVLPLVVWFLLLEERISRPIASPGQIIAEQARHPKALKHRFPGGPQSGQCCANGVGDFVAKVRDFVATVVATVVGWAFCLAVLFGAYGLGVSVATYFGEGDREMVGCGLPYAAMAR
jgi:hypothetical protein